jgi:hypothetical protein
MTTDLTTIDLTTDYLTPIPDGTPATMHFGYTSSTYPATVVGVERFKSGSRGSLVKRVTVRQVARDGSAVGEPIRFIAKPDGRLVEVGNAWNSLTLGVAVYTPYMD